MDEQKSERIAKKHKNETLAALKEIEMSKSSQSESTPKPTQVSSNEPIKKYKRKIKKKVQEEQQSSTPSALPSVRKTLSQPKDLENIEKWEKLY